MNVHPVTDINVSPGIADRLTVLHDWSSLIDGSDRNLVPLRYGGEWHYRFVT